MNCWRIALIAVVVLAALPMPKSSRPPRCRAFLKGCCPCTRSLGRPSPRLAGGAQGARPVLRAVPCRPADPRGQAAAEIYVQPLGEFDSAQRKVLDRTAEFLGIYFQLPVKVRDDLSLDVIPASARREHPTWHVKQILSTYVLEKVLPPRLPADACVYLALTTSDLWPGEGWNFVFGQASLSDRVGVWSIARTATRTGAMPSSACACSAPKDRLARDGPHVLHATLHVIRVQHVRQQSSRRSGPPPLVALPPLPGKALPRHGRRPARRFKDLAAFSKRAGLKEEQAFYEKSLAVLENAK